MNSTTHCWYSPHRPARPDVAPDDPRLVRVLEEYLAALEAGDRPQRDALLARHPDLAGELAECLDGLEMMQVLAGPGDANSAPVLETPPVGTLDRAPAVPLGDYHLLREIGRGGMGIVYEAQQLSLGRRVALKVLPFAATLDPKQLQRFRNEAQAAANLHHPHIVPVFAVGCERGVHYYAMQFIDGQNLASLLEELRQQAGGKEETIVRAGDTVPHVAPSLSTDYATGKPDACRAVARLGVQAAQALEYAHQMGVVHRDIKPANLLLDLRSNLWVTDFGLAQFRGHPGLTLTGDVLGTLRYMSPEQALARHGLLDHRTDVYSLGATLYELLTLQPVHSGNDREELLRQIAEGEPVALRRLNPAVPRELETIVLKALAQTPEDRYGTALELADDLQRFLDDRPILARRPSAPQRLRRWARRHRPLVGSLSVALAVLLLGSIVGALVYAGKQHDLAGEQARFAQTKEQLRQETAEKLYRSLLREAGALRLARQPGYRTQVWADLHEAAGLAGPWNNPNEIRTHVLACVGDPRGLEQPAILPAAPQSVAPVLCPRFQEILQNAGGMKIVRNTAVSPDGKWLAISGPCGAVTLWSQEAGKGPPAARQLWLGSDYHLLFMPNSQYLVAGCEDGVIVWSVPNLVQQWFVRSGPVVSVALHPGCRLLAAAGKQVEVWSIASNRLVASFPIPHYGGRADFSADGKFLLIVEGGKTVAAWPVSDSPEKHYLTGHDGGVPAVAFSPDGNTLASGAKDQTVKIWDAASGRLRCTCKGHKGPIEALAFSPDGSLLATGATGGGVRLWDPSSGKEIGQAVVGGVASRVWRLQFSASGKYLAAAGETGIVVWEVAADGGGLSVPPYLTIPHAGAIDLAVHPSGSALVFLNRPGRLYVADLGRGGNPRLLGPSSRPELRGLNFDAAGKHLTFVSPDGKLTLWDWDRGVARPTGLKAFQVALNRQGNRIATSNTAHAVVVHDLQTRREVLTLPPEGNDVWSLAWSPDGTRVAVGLADGLAIWDLEQVRARLAEFGLALEAPVSP
jgi:serine/threonine protein kinase/WD40 repeat protein